MDSGCAICFSQWYDVTKIKKLTAAGGVRQNVAEDHVTAGQAVTSNSAITAIFKIIAIRL
jgi:hypothetical protein